ncbi:hypothetical protein BH10BAC3_BH10BAC3_30140 [soil metagenome]
MKKEDIPQDPSALGRITKEVCYAVDASGNYVTELSNGWEIKAAALDITWQDIEANTEKARQKVLNKEASPLLYFMELRIMDMATLAAYSGFWKWQIKRHLKPAVFEKLSTKKLQRYATAFDVTMEALKTMNVHEG